MSIRTANYEKGSSIKIRNPCFIDVFAGCGGLSLGLLQSGWRGLFAIEHDENAFQTLSHNLISHNTPLNFEWPQWLPKKNLGITELLNEHREQLKSLSGKVDLLVGGPPCQGFSSAGKRNPSDPRNQLAKEYLKLVNILKPKVVLIENVRGFASDFKAKSKGTKTLNYAKWIIEVLGKDYTVASKMIDLSLFAVPQKRHRYFIVGISKSCTHSTADIFDLVEHNRLSFIRGKGLQSTFVSTQMAISDLEVVHNGTVKSHENPKFEEILYSSPITNYQTIMNLGHEGCMRDTRLARHKPEIKARFAKLIEICKSEGRLNTSLSPELKASFGLRKNAIRVLDPEAPSPTITSMPDDLIHYSEPRALTVRENARLQSFPDWFVFKGKYTTGGKRRRKEVPRFTQVANAVPPLVSEAFGTAILKLLSEKIEASSFNLEKDDPTLPESLRA